MKKLKPIRLTGIPAICFPSIRKRSRRKYLYGNDFSDFPFQEEEKKVNGLIDNINTFKKYSGASALPYQLFSKSLCYLYNIYVVLRMDFESYINRHNKWDVSEGKWFEQWCHKKTFKFFDQLLCICRDEIKCYLAEHKKANLIDCDSAVEFLRLLDKYGVSANYIILEKISTFFTVLVQDIETEMSYDDFGNMTLEMTGLPEFTIEGLKYMDIYYKDMAYFQVMGITEDKFSKFYCGITGGGGLQGISEYTYSLLHKDAYCLMQEPLCSEIDNIFHNILILWKSIFSLSPEIRFGHESKIFKIVLQHLWSKLNELIIADNKQAVSLKEYLELDCASKVNGDYSIEIIRDILETMSLSSINFNIEENGAGILKMEHYYDSDPLPKYVSLKQAC